MRVSIEPVGVGDLDELIRIESECFAEEAYSKRHLALLLCDSKAVSLLARVDGEVAAFIIGAVEDYKSRRVGHVYTIDVTVRHRREGIGRRLLEEVEKAFLKEGAEISYLEVRSDNEAARGLYQKQGYQKVESMVNYYSRGVSGLRLRKLLRSGEGPL